MGKLVILLACVLFVVYSLLLPPSSGADDGQDLDDGDSADATGGPVFVEEDSDERMYQYPKEGEYKYVAVVTSKAGVCTAVIVTPEYVLTAAHCFYYKENQIRDADARVVAGIVNYEVPKEETKQESMSIDIIIHPSFRYKVPSKYDVALVKLRDKFEFNQYVDKAPISTKLWPQTGNKLMECMVLGFGGYRSSFPASYDLKKWTVLAEHGEGACPCALRFQAKRLVCVKEATHPHICKVDDGGPLVCQGEVRAIVHMVWNRVTCDSAEYPVEKCGGGIERGLSLFMYLCPVSDWLHQIVSDIAEKPSGSCRGSRLLVLHSCWTVTAFMTLTLAVTLVLSVP